MKNLVLSVALCLFGMSVSASRPKESRTRYYRHEVNAALPKTHGNGLLKFKSFQGRMELKRVE